MYKDITRRHNLRIWNISVPWIVIDSQFKQKREERVITSTESKFLEGKTLDMGTSTTNRWSSKQQYLRAKPHAKAKTAAVEHRPT